MLDQINTILRQFGLVWRSGMGAFEYVGAQPQIPSQAKPLPSTIHAWQIVQVWYPADWGVEVSADPNDLSNMQGNLFTSSPTDAYSVNLPASAVLAAFDAKFQAQYQKALVGRYGAGSQLVAAYTTLLAILHQAPAGSVNMSGMSTAQKEGLLMDSLKTFNTFMHDVLAVLDGYVNTAVKKMAADLTSGNYPSITAPAFDLSGFDPAVFYIPGTGQYNPRGPSSPLVMGDVTYSYWLDLGGFGAMEFLYYMLKRWFNYEPGG